MLWWRIYIEDDGVDDAEDGDNADDGDDGYQISG